VEHGVTEQVTGVDLVEWMIRLAAGEMPFAEGFSPQPTGHSIQVRLYAEDPAKGFQPSSGLLTEVDFPEGVRCDTWVEAGIEVPPFYDPMLAKLIVHADSREAALGALQEALAATRLSGIETNLAYLRQVLADPVFAEGRQTTRYLSHLVHQAPTIDVLSPGTQTTVQDFPGRTGYWDVGVPPSGPMDDYAFRLANRLVGNPEGAAGLELTVTGPSLRFNLETAVGRPPGCVRRGVWQGTTRRNSATIPTSCNAARRRAVRALVVVAPLTSRVGPRFLNTHQQNNHLPATRSGQLRFLGSTSTR